MTESIYSKLLETAPKASNAASKASQALKSTSGKKTGKIALKSAKETPQFKVPYPTAKTEEATPVKTKKRGKLVSRGVSKEVSKFTSKYDPAINKVGFYFTRHEIDKLDKLFTELKPALRDQHGKKITKNELVRACLEVGIKETSKLVEILVKK